MWKIPDSSQRYNGNRNFEISPSVSYYTCRWLDPLNNWLVVAIHKEFCEYFKWKFPIWQHHTFPLPLSEAFVNEMCSHVRCMLVILCMKKNSIHTFSALWFNAAEWLFFLRQCFYVCKKLIILLPDVIISFLLTSWLPSFDIFLKLIFKNISRASSHHFKLQVKEFWITFYAIIIYDAQNKKKQFVDGDELLC